MTSTRSATFNKFLKTARVIMDSVVDGMSKLFCCCCQEASHRHLQWMLFKQNAFVTIGYFLLYLAFGMCVGFMGPTLEDLACYTESTVSSITWAFFAQTSCMVVGVFISGVVSKCKSTMLSPDFLLLISVALLPLTLLMVSFTRRLEMLVVIMAVMGLAMGTIDCLTNLQLIHLYDKAVAPFLQAMYFFYGIGAFLSPMLAKAYLLDRDCSVLVKESEMNSAVQSELRNSSSVEQMLLEATNETEVYIAFRIIAAMQVPVVVYVVALVAKTGFRMKTVSPEFKRLINSESKPILQELNEKEKNKMEMHKLVTQWQQYLQGFQECYSISFSKALLLTITACLMVFIYDGLQGHVNEFSQTYAMKILKNDVGEDLELINSSFWGAYSLGRLLSVVLAIKFTPYFMLLISIIGCQVGVFMFLSCVGGQSFYMLVAASVVLGLSMSSITPTTITMTEQFMDMANIQMSMIIGGAALGEMIIPIIEGQLIDEHPITYVTLLLVMVGLSWLVYAAFWLFGRVTQKYKAMASSSFIWYNPPEMEKDDSDQEEAELSAQNYSNDMQFHTTSLQSSASYTEHDEKVDTSEKDIIG